MKKYLLLMRESPDFWAGLSPAEVQACIDKYKAWSIALREKNAMVDGNGLGYDGCTARRQNGKVIVTDGPYTEAKELIAGYFMLQAEDYAAAEALIADCPHLEWGSLELRQLGDY